MVSKVFSYSKMLQFYLRIFLKYGIVTSVIFCVFILISFNFRYDEWIKADKIVRPADKNVPKIKHRKKIKVSTYFAIS